MKYRRLGDISIVKQGRHHYHFTEGEEYDLIKSSNLYPGYYSPIPPFEKIKSDERVSTLEDNDILLCHMGSNIGKVSICHEIGPNVTCNQTITVVRSTKVIPIYLYAYLASHGVVDYVSSKSGGNYLSRSKVLSIPILIPPVEVQFEISRKVSSYAGVQRNAILLMEEWENDIYKLIRSSKGELK